MSLKKWFKEEWVDISRPKKGKYPKCVPKAKAARMTAAQKKSAIRRKRKAGNPGGKPTMVKTFVKKKRKATMKRRKK